MDQTRMSNKGQVVIPHRIRHAHGWGAGVRFAVEQIEGGIALRPIGDAATVPVDEVFGCLDYDGPRKSLAAMDAAIARGVRSRR